jgi:hypothetical protein
MPAILPDTIGPNRATILEVNHIGAAPQHRYQEHQWQGNMRSHERILATAESRE